MSLTADQIIAATIPAVPLIDYNQLNPLKDIPGLLAQTVAVVEEKTAVLQARRCILVYIGALTSA